MLKCFKVIITFTSQFSPVLVQYFSSLVQAVTSQAENYKHLKGVLIEWISQELFEYNVFRINQANLAEKRYSVLAKLRVENSACDVTVCFPSSLSR